MDGFELRSLENAGHSRHSPVLRSRSSFRTPRRKVLRWKTSCTSQRLSHTAKLVHMIHSCCTAAQVHSAKAGGGQAVV